MFCQILCDGQNGILFAYDCLVLLCRASIEAMKALAALTDASLPNQDRAVQAGAPAGLCQAALQLTQSEAPADPEAACKSACETVSALLVLPLVIMITVAITVII